MHGLDPADAEALRDLSGTDQVLDLEPLAAGATALTHQLAGSRTPGAGRRPRTADTEPNGRHLASRARYGTWRPRLRAQRSMSGQYQT